MAPTAEIINNPFPVAEKSTVELVVVPDDNLAIGDRIQVQFPNSWLLVSGPSFTRNVQVTDPEDDHFISASCDGAEFEVEISERNFYFPEGQSRHGRLFTARLTDGNVPAGKEVTIRYSNTPAAYVAQEAELHVRVKGVAPASVPTVVTVPEEAVHLRVIVPSSARTGTEFEVLIASLDRFDNCSCSEYSGSLETIGAKPVAADLSFTGSVRVPVALKEEGVYRFRFNGVLSNAIKVSGEARGPFWGDIHLHTGISSDGQGVIPHKYAREVSGLDFCGTCDHTEDLGDNGFDQTLSWAREAYEPGKYVTFLCDERNPGHWTGHHNAYFRDEESFKRCQLRPGRFPRGSDEESLESVEKINAEPENCLLIPHHTGMGWGGLPKKGISSAVDWDAIEDDKDLRPFMEIYSHHGQSELYSPHHILAYEFNRMRNIEKRSNTCVPGPFYAQDHWVAGRRVGVIGSSDEHSGLAGRRHGGIAAVFSDELTREGIFDALRNRHCYATTGERILLEFSVDGVDMGQEDSRKKGSTLPIALKVWGTDMLVRVEILRHRFGVDDGFKLIEAVSPREQASKNSGHLAVGRGVPRMTTDAVVELKDELTGPTVYYARVLQEPLEWPAMAWTSPVWINAR